MASPTLGFSLSADEQQRVRHLADLFAHGNRSEWLRQATDLFEQWAVFQALAKTQARGTQLTAHHGIAQRDIPSLVAKAATNPSEAAWLDALVEELTASSPDPTATDEAELHGFLGNP
jgi:hypothetical protein